jgi:hypothetical protein
MRPGRHCNASQSPSGTHLFLATGNKFSHRLAHGYVSIHVPPEPELWRLLGHPLQGPLLMQSLNMPSQPLPFTRSIRNHLQSPAGGRTACRIDKSTMFRLQDCRHGLCGGVETHGVQTQYPSHVLTNWTRFAATERALRSLTNSSVITISHSTQPRN